MNREMILWPVLCQIGLTIVLYIRLARAKKKAAALNEVDEGRRSLYDDAWPDYVIQINNCIRNQFEVPVLFYVLTVLLYLLDAVTYLTLVLAWAFVLLRIGHAYVHTGTNYVPVRRKLFMASVFTTLGLFVLCVYAVLVG